MTIAGTIVHLAKVEEMWTASAAGRDHGPPTTGPEPWTAGGAEWTRAAEARPEELYALWYDTIGRCQREWTDLVRHGGLDELVQDDPEYQVSRRRRLVDILEEHLLHTGQTSIVRETIDGLVGNAPP